jgi:hypothetical protein
MRLRTSLVRLDYVGKKGSLCMMMIKCYIVGQTLY